jgi:hypothetical protein
MATFNRFDINIKCSNNIIIIALNSITRNNHLSLRCRASLVLLLLFLLLLQEGELGRNEETNRIRPQR